MTNHERIYVDLHVLQTVPPSCVNRDDTGSPKTARYGGVTRARVSSQAWKRVMRLKFQEMLTADEVSKRTKLVVDLIAKEISGVRPEYSEKQAQTLARKVLEAAKVTVKEVKKNKKDEKDEKTGEDKVELKTEALFFISPAQVRALAEIALTRDNDKLDKAECQAALKSQPGVDQALFGRMLADDPSLNYDAAAQVAHAISTHAVENEYDYFTAVDDCSKEDNAGAGHLGTVEFNSSTLYRYATVNVSELYRSLGNRTPEAVRAFAEAFIRTMPTGKQNSFANWTRPDAVYVTIRRDQPINMAGAFEEAVKEKGHGYVQGSIESLVKYAKETYEKYEPAPVLALTVGKGMETLGEPCSVDGLLDTLEAWLKDQEEQK